MVWEDDAHIFDYDAVDSHGKTKYLMEPRTASEIRADDEYWSSRMPDTFTPSCLEKGLRKSYVCQLFDPDKPVNVMLTYDLGDYWTHKISLLEMEYPRDAKVVYPLVSDGSGLCPPENFHVFYSWKETVKNVNEKGDRRQVEGMMSAYRRAWGANGPWDSVIRSNGDRAGSIDLGFFDKEWTNRWRFNHKAKKGRCECGHCERVYM